MRIFGEDTQMIQDGVKYLRSYIFDLLIFPFLYCYNSYLIGSGHTLFALTNNLFSSLLLRVPVCNFFGVALGWGLTGVGLGTPVTNICVLAVVIVYLYEGTHYWPSGGGDSKNNKENVHEGSL